MIRSHRIDPPMDATVFEATYGAPVEMEWWLTKESETSFFDNELSVDLVLDSNSKLIQFLHLQPWFCQHVVFVVKSDRPPRTINVLIESFHSITILGQKTAIVGVKLRPVSNLIACEIIEESHRTMETYNGTQVDKLKEKHDERAKQYFNSGLIPRLDI